MKNVPLLQQFMTANNNYTVIVHCGLHCDKHIDEVVASIEASVQHLHEQVTTVKPLKDVSISIAHFLIIYRNTFVYF